MVRSSFRFCGAMLAASFLVMPASARPQMTAPATTEGDFVVHNFKFQSGESLPDVRLHYTTLGKPARDAQGRTTNAVLILHGTGGSATVMRETKRKAIEEALWRSGRGSIQTALSELRAFAMNQLEDIRTLLRGEVRAARFKLSKHLDRIERTLCR